MKIPFHETYVNALNPGLLLGKSPQIARNPYENHVFWKKWLVLRVSYNFITCSHY